MEIVCPRCRQEGNLNPVGVVEVTGKTTFGHTTYTSYVVSCDKHGEFEFVGNLDALSYKSAKRENFEALKRNVKLSVNLGFVEVARGLSMIADFVDKKRDEREAR